MRRKHNRKSDLERDNRSLGKSLSAMRDQARLDAEARETLEARIAAFENYNRPRILSVTAKINGVGFNAMLPDDPYVLSSWLQKVVIPRLGRTQRDRCELSMVDFGDPS